MTVVSDIETKWLINKHILNKTVSHYNRPIIYIAWHRGVAPCKKACTINIVFMYA